MKKITFKVKEVTTTYVTITAESMIDAIEEMDELLNDGESVYELFTKNISDVTHEYEIADNEEV